jgi:hypothetical protein
MKRLFFVAATLASAACKLLGTIACTADARAAISVDVRDSVTNAPITARLQR